MFSKAIILAILGLTGSSTAHMIMATPVPYGKSSLNNSPLLPDGSDFPCKQRSGVYDAAEASNSMALGSSQPLSFTGGATHGGGSCQVSITYDKNPTKDSTFKVIASIEGGCPVQGEAGNIGDDAGAADPSKYNFTVPSNIPAGDATLAWTWFNKVGNREMYMNCAPVTLTGGSSKRSTPRLDARDQAAFSALPDMFVANIGNGCGTDNGDLAFPDPGDSLEQLGMATMKPLPPTGASCGAAKAPAATGSSGSGSSGAGAGSGAASSSAPAVTSSAVAESAAPGVFATGSGSAGAASGGAVATSVSVPAVAASTGSASSSSNSSSSSSSGSTAGGLTGACTSEGMWNCIGGTSFQQCASGMWSAVQPVAAGTTCASGQTMNLSIARRSIRFDV